MASDKEDKINVPAQDPDAKMGETLSLQGSMQVAEEGVDNHYRGRKVLRRIDLW
jgi:MFS transporter, ACS family, allantoate permease